MKYEDLSKVNAEIKYIPMGDDKYAPVAERILAFKMIYPEGFIITELTADNKGDNVFRTAVGFYENGNQHILGTGTAREKAFDSVDNISPLERAETASVGRALGMAGFGVTTSVCSYEEYNDAVIPVAGDITANKPKKKAKAVVETPEPIAIANDTKEDNVETPAVVEEPMAESVEEPMPEKATEHTTNDNSGSSVKLATERQQSIISKYYGNKLSELLESVGATSIDTLSYANAAEIIAQMTSA